LIILYYRSFLIIGLETNKNIKKALNRVFNYAIKVGYIKTNPIELVTVSGIEKHHKKDEILEYDDFINLVNILKSRNEFNYNSHMH